MGVYDQVRREVASGLAGTSIARRQSSIDSLAEVYGRSSPSGPGASGTSNLPSREDLIGLLGPGAQEPGQFRDFDSVIDTPTSRVNTFDPIVGVLGPKHDLYPNAVQGTQPSVASPASILTTDAQRGSIAGGDDALTRAVSTIANTADFDFQSNTLKTAYDRARTDFYNEREAQVADLASQYRDRIGSLQDELAGYRGGLIGVNKAYGEYADDANAILEQAASVEADELTDSAVPETVDDSFDDFDGEMRETLKRIDSSGNKALAQAMSDEVRYMQETMTDGLRSGLATQDEMHALAGAQAQALAHMAWKDDVYQAEKSRFTLETQINKSIGDKQDEIAAQTAAMNSAIDQARAQFGEFEMSPDQLWQAGMNDYFANTEIDDFTRGTIMQRWANIQDRDPGAFKNFDAFKGEVMRTVNAENLAKVGLIDEYGLYMDQLDQNGTQEQKQQAEALMTGANTRTGIERLVRGMEFLGIDVSKTQNIDWDELETTSGFETQTMLDLWKHYDDFSRNYNDYRQTQATNANTPNVQRGRTAPNNAQNKNNADFVYRRNVIAPHFAQKVKEAFPGAEIGGLRYIRPANDTGGANVSNSDHHSGGAIDVYHKGGSAADTDRMLRQIVRWADQPGVSFTVYDGQSAHQTGTSNAHVHISFQVGYRL